MPEPSIVIDSVSKRLGGKQVLRGVNLSVAPGESVVIIGRSGTGKSVLLKHVVVMPAHSFMITVVCAMTSFAFG